MSSYDAKTILEKVADTIRCLSIDAIQRANSGHPGMPMGCADFAAVLWGKILKHNPRNPAWPDRDRFVLSAGHGSAMLYSVLHLSGYGVTMEDLKNFRQWGSPTPGHPEFGCAPGVETTTGPLGQGFANAVGLALAERIVASRFNTGGASHVDHFTYGIAGDGDLMEGISHEAADLAGHLKLGKLILFYDSNEITIEGSTALTTSENVAKRFGAYGWHVQEIDGHDHAAIETALLNARAEGDAPSLIVGRTHIAKGSPNKQDSAGAHGAPLGEDEIKLTKEALGWPREEFFVPPEVRQFFEARCDEMARAEREWKDRFAQSAEESPEFTADWERWFSAELPGDPAAHMPDFVASDNLATRVASGKVLQSMAGVYENMIGGSADLAPSNKTFIDGAPTIGPDLHGGRNIHFGVREHAMGALVNGLGLHGGVIPYCGTFLVFADYMRPAIRVAAMSRVPAIYVFTHDSIFVGEDGPTHQPVEHLASLRSIPNLVVIRPCDARETAAAWEAALRNRTAPTALILSRQKLPVLDVDAPPAVGRGAWVVSPESEGPPEMILIASGSEVHAAIGAKKILGERGSKVRVVSLPSWELFDQQPKDYRDEVLPPSCTLRLAVEAGLPMGWEKYTAAPDRVVGIETFGASAPYAVLAEKFGMTGEAVAARALALLDR